MLQEPSPGRFVAAPRGPMVAYFDKMSCNRCNEAPSCGFCHRSIAADCCPARFADEFRRWAFSASPASQSVRWLFRSIAPESRTPSYSLLSARADAFRTAVPFNVGFLSCGASWSFSSWSHLFWGEIKSPHQGENPQLGGKPIGRALAVLDASSLSRNRSGHSVSARRSAWGTGSP